MQSWKGKPILNAVKAYLLVSAHSCASLHGASSSLYGNSSLFSSGVLTGSGDNDVDDASLFLRHVPRGFGLFLLGSSFSSIGLAFQFFYSLVASFVPISHKRQVFQRQKQMFFSFHLSGIEFVQMPHIYKHQRY